MHRMPAREFRLKLASGLRSAMPGEQAAHPIESRTRPALRAETAPAVNWRQAVFGIFTALLVFVAMLVLGR